MRFIADAMLGRLATWMRIIGCDVSYYRSIGDRQLVDLALKEKRMILTRDTLLIRRKMAKDNFFLVEGNRYQDQLKQVAKQFSLDPYKNLLTRCLECNIQLTDLEKKKTRGFVPEYVYESQSIFMTCPACRKMYWPATHRGGIIRTLQEIFGE